MADLSWRQLDMLFGARRSGSVEGSTPLDAADLYGEAAVTVLREWSEGKSSSESNASQRLG
jgi:hypothetical protein